MSDCGRQSDSRMVREADAKMKGLPLLNVGCYDLVRASACPQSPWTSLTQAAVANVARQILMLEMHPLKL